MNIMDLKKLLAAALALTMCFGMTACGNEDDDDDDDDRSSGRKHSRRDDSSDSEDDSFADSEDEPRILEPKKVTPSSADESSVPEVAIAEEEKAYGDSGDKLPDTQLANTTVKWMANYDLNGSVRGQDPMGVQLFKDKYNGSVEFVYVNWTDRFTELEKLVLNHDSPDLVPAGDMDEFPKGVIKGCFQPFDSYVDFSSELWQETAHINEAYKIGGKHYLCATELSPNYVCIYNMNAIYDYSFEDPAELFYNGEWTWDTFSFMCEEFTDHNAERYGLDGYWYPQALSETCGLPMIGLEDGKLVNNMGDPRIADVQSLMYDLQQGGVCFDRKKNAGITRGSGETGYGIGTFETLFWPAGLWALENTPDNTALFGDVESGDVMFVPMPRMDDSDTYYISSTFDGCFMAEGAPNPEGAAALMNCEMATREYDREAYNSILKEDYMWTDEMIEMRDTIYDMAKENPVVSFNDGISPEMDKNIQDVTFATMPDGGDAITWKECQKQYQKKVDKLIDDANKAL